MATPFDNENVDPLPVIFPSRYSLKMLNGISAELTPVKLPEILYTTSTPVWAPVADNIPSLDWTNSCGTTTSILFVCPVNTTALRALLSTFIHLLNDVVAWVLSHLTVGSNVVGAPAVDDVYLVVDFLTILKNSSWALFMFKPARDKSLDVIVLVNDAPTGKVLWVETLILNSWVVSDKALSADIIVPSEAALRCHVSPVIGITFKLSKIVWTLTHFSRLGKVTLTASGFEGMNLVPSVDVHLAWIDPSTIAFLSSVWVVEPTVVEPVVK